MHTRDLAAQPAVRRAADDGDLASLNLFPDDGIWPDSLMRRADLAM